MSDLVLKQPMENIVYVLYAKKNLVILNEVNDDYMYLGSDGSYL